MAALSLMGKEMFAMEAGGLSPAVYWWRSHAVERVEITVELASGEAQLSPSEALEAMLERLLAEAPVR